MAVEAPARLHHYREVFRPAPRLSLSEWADKYGYLSDGQKWDTSVVPYLREPMDATTDRTVREVVIEKAARLGYTEGVIGQRIGYDMHHDPRRMLIVLPTVDDAKDWSQTQLRPMVEAAPVLRDIMPAARGRDSGNKILDKKFPGGFIKSRGAHSPKGLRRHTADDVILDEVDGMEATAGKEGDPIMLSVRAVRTVADSKVIMGSTPGVVGSSRIRAALKNSDWREYHVPCPRCHEFQTLDWGGEKAAHGIKWAKEICCKSCGLVLEGEVACSCGSEERAVTHLPETAHYVCRHCAGAIEEHEKPGMLEKGKWIPRYPGRAIRGYKIPGTLSPFTNASWAKMADEFLKAKGDPSTLQVWVNQWLGDPFENTGAKVDAGTLERRAVQYVAADGRIVEVPDGVGVLTAGVDVQGDRLELLVRGYGIAWETWDVLHERIYGPPQHTDTWARLAHFLTRTYRHEKGGALPITIAFVDSGDGNTVEYVYNFVKFRPGVWASKGDAGKADAKFPQAPHRAHATAVAVWPVATFPAKASLFYRLGLTIADDQLRGGAGRIHLRAQGSGLCNGFDAEYFAQFSAEEKRRVRIEGTAKYEERYIQTRTRNEAIDLHVLADSAFRALGPGMLAAMPEWVEAARQPPSKEPPPPPQQESGGDWATRNGSWGSSW